jgi:predicted component of type VI protein secretion system
VTTRVKSIQSFVDELVLLDYSDAIQAIKQENAFSASKNIQTRYNETADWEIIEKGADLLDPKSLPTPKGPLDEFTMAEKVATERFMRDAGYGLSLANQRQRRLLWKRLCEMRKMGVDLLPRLELTRGVYSHC